METIEDDLKYEIIKKTDGWHVMDASIDVDLGTFKFEHQARKWLSKNAKW